MDEWIEKVTALGSHHYKGLFCMPDMKKSVMEWIEDGLEFAEGDIVIICYPCTGIQWLQECMWLMKHPELIGSTEKKTELSYRVMFLDRAHREEDPKILMAKQEVPRIFKCHVGSDLLGKHINEGKAKFIFWTMEPKGALCKFHHHMDFLGPKWLGLPPCPWEVYWQLVKEKKMFEGDYIDFHLGYQDYLDKENVMVGKFEDAAEDKVAALRQVADFCGFKLTDEQLTKISECQPIDKTQKVDAKFTPEQAKYYNDRMMNELKGTRFENMYQY